MTAEQFIKDTRETCERATVGPVVLLHSKAGAAVYLERQSMIANGVPFARFVDVEDAQAFVHNRTALPKALAALEKALEALKRSECMCTPAMGGKDWHSEAWTCRRCTTVSEIDQILGG